MLGDEEDEPKHESDGEDLMEGKSSFNKVNITLSYGNMICDVKF